MTRDEYEKRYKESLTPFQAKVMALDAALTGKSREAEHGARQKRVQPHDMVFGGEPVYYLADGGYSRLGFSFDRRRCFLTSNSIQSTRDRWNDCAALIEAVESEINAWLDSQ